MGSNLFVVCLFYHIYLNTLAHRLLFVAYLLLPPCANAPAHVSRLPNLWLCRGTLTLKHNGRKAQDDASIIDAALAASPVAETLTENQTSELLTDTLWDFYTQTTWKQYHAKTPYPSRIEQYCPTINGGCMGVFMTPDGVFRRDVPRVTERVSKGPYTHNLVGGWWGHLHCYPQKVAAIRWAGDRGGMIVLW